MENIKDEKGVPLEESRALVTSKIKPVIRRSNIKLSENISDCEKLLAEGANVVHKESTVPKGKPKASSLVPVDDVPKEEVLLSDVNSSSITSDNDWKDINLADFTVISETNENDSGDETVEEQKSEVKPKQKLRKLIKWDDPPMVHRNAAISEISGSKLPDDSHFSRVVFIGDSYLNDLYSSWPKKSDFQPYFIWKKMIRIGEVVEILKHHSFLKECPRLLLIFCLGNSDIVKFSKFKRCLTAHQRIPIPIDVTKADVIKKCDQIHFTMSTLYPESHFVFTNFPNLKFCANVKEILSAVNKKWHNCICRYNVGTHIQEIYDRTLTTINQHIFSMATASTNAYHFNIVGLEVFLDDSEWKLPSTAKTPLATQLYNRLLSLILPCEKMIDTRIEHSPESIADVPIYILGDIWLKPICNNWQLSKSLNPLFWPCENYSFQGVKDFLLSAVLPDDPCLIIVSIAADVFLSCKQHACQEHAPLKYQVPRMCSAIELRNEIVTEMEAISVILESRRKCKLFYMTCIPISFKAYLNCVRAAHNKECSKNIMCVKKPLMTNAQCMSAWQSMNEKMEVLDELIVSYNMENGSHTCDMGRLIRKIASADEFLFPSFIPGSPLPRNVESKGLILLKEYLHGVGKLFDTGKLDHYNAKEALKRTLERKSKVGIYADIKVTIKNEVSVSDNEIGTLAGPKEMNKYDAKVHDSMCKTSMEATLPVAMHSGETLALPDNKQDTLSDLDLQVISECSESEKLSDHASNFSDVSSVCVPENDDNKTFNDTCIELIRNSCTHDEESINSPEKVHNDEARTVKDTDSISSEEGTIAKEIADDQDDMQSISSDEDMVDKDAAVPLDDMESISSEEGTVDKEAIVILDDMESISSDEGTDAKKLSPSKDDMESISSVGSELQGEQCTESISSEENLINASQSLANDENLRINESKEANCSEVHLEQSEPAIIEDSGDTKADVKDIDLFDSKNGDNDIGATHHIVCDNAMTDTDQLNTNLIIADSLVNIELKEKCSDTTEDQSNLESTSRQHGNDHKTKTENANLSANSEENVGSLGQIEEDGCSKKDTERSASNEINNTDIKTEVSQEKQVDATNSTADMTPIIVITEHSSRKPADRRRMQVQGRKAAKGHKNKLKNVINETTEVQNVVLEEAKTAMAATEEQQPEENVTKPSTKVNVANLLKAKNKARILNQKQKDKLTRQQRINDIRRRGVTKKSTLKVSTNENNTGGFMVESKTPAENVLNESEISVGSNNLEKPTEQTSTEGLKGEKPITSAEEAVPEIVMVDNTKDTSVKGKNSSTKKVDCTGRTNIIKTVNTTSIRKNSAQSAIKKSEKAPVEGNKKPQKDESSKGISRLINCNSRYGQSGPHTSNQESSHAGNIPAQVPMYPPPTINYWAQPNSGQWNWTTNATVPPTCNSWDPRNFQSGPPADYSRLPHQQDVNYPKDAEHKKKDTIQEDQRPSVNYRSPPRAKYSRDRSPRYSSRSHDSERYRIDKRKPSRMSPSHRRISPPRMNSPEVDYSRLSSKLDVNYPKDVEEEKIYTSRDGRRPAVNYRSPTRTKYMKDRSPIRSPDRYSSRSHGSSQRGHRASRRDESKPSRRSPAHATKRSRKSIERVALESLREAHDRECNLYRNNPAAHPDYGKEKRQWFEMMASHHGYTADSYFLQEKWRSVWLGKIEVNFNNCWEEKKNKCLSLLPSDKRSRSHSGSRDTSSKRHKPRKSAQSQSSLFEPGSSYSTANYPFSSPLASLESIDDLEKRISEYITRSSGTYTSAGNPPMLPNLTTNYPSSSRVQNAFTTAPPATQEHYKKPISVLEVTSVLSEISDRFGNLGPFIKSLHDQLTLDNLMKKNLMDAVVDDDALLLLKMVSDQLKHFLSDSSTSVVQKAIFMEAQEKLTGLLNAATTSKTPFNPLQMESLRNLTQGMDMLQTLKLIKENLILKERCHPGDQEVMNVYIALKAAEKENPAMPYSARPTFKQMLKNAVGPRRDMTQPPPILGILPVRPESKSTLIKANFNSLSNVQKLDKFRNFSSLPFEEKSALLSYLDETESSNPHFAKVLRMMINDRR